MAGLLDLWVVPALLALVPAAYRLWRGRRMAAYASDAALPERLAGSRNTLGGIFAAAGALLAVAWPRHLAWSLPLLLLAFLAAGWPLRRVLFGETWSLGAYLWFYLRLILAIYGFWFLLMAAPWLAADARGWPGLAALAAVLLIWNHQNSRIIRALLVARPVSTPALLDRFAAIVARAKMPSPRIDYVDMRGGVLVNAVALPDTERPGVLFSSSLLDRLEEREVAAIFAHEVAHLEHFNRAYLEKLRWAAWAIIAAAVLLGPLVRSYVPGAAWLLWLWPGVVVGYVAVLTQMRQKHETESDLRAVALSGDPEALISGLVRLHALARLPRRLDPAFEASASHPSLARRVRDIREAGRITAAALDAPVTLASGTTTVTLHPERLEWREGDASTHSLAYASLADLRLAADNKNVTRLIASDPQGRQWSMPLAVEDVARAQSALDVIDARVRPAAVTSALHQTVGTLVALIVVVSATGAGQIAAWIVAGLAVFSFERPMTRAAGVAGLVAATLALREPSSIQFPLILLLSSGLLLYLGHRDARVVFAARTWRFVNVTGVLAVLTCLPLVWWGARLLSLHQTARVWTAPAVYALAFAAANAMRERRRQPLTIAALVAGIAVIVLGETRTIDTFLGDPFLERSFVRTATPIRGEAFSSFTVDFAPSRLILAPDAGALVIAREDEDHRLEMHIGRPGAAFTAIEAADALFIDSGRVLLLREEPDTTTLLLVDVDRPAAPLWQHSLDLTSASLAIDRASSRWRVIGQGDGDVIVAVSGAMDGGPMETLRWRVNQSLGSTSPLAIAGSGVLVSETRYEGFSDADWGEEWWSPFMSRASMSTTFAVIDGTTRRQLFESSLLISCAAGRYVDDGPVCAANDGTRTHLARINPVDGTLSPLAQFRTFISPELTQRWVVGWSHARFALDLESDALFTAEAVSDRVNRAVAIGGAEQVVAVATTNPTDGGATIRLYRIAGGGSATR